MLDKMNNIILFSVTAHESHESLNLLIENCLHFSPNSYIVVHINKSWKSFKPEKINHLNKNVFINPKQFLLNDRLEGKSVLHITNIEYFNSLCIDYHHVVLMASNQLLLKPINFDFINSVRYGSDYLSISPNYEIFSKIPHPDTAFINLQVQHLLPQLTDISIKNGMFGGRHEGMFFSKEIGIKMINTFKKYFNYTVNLCRCDEEIILHTILYNLVTPTDTESICFFPKNVVPSEIEINEFVNNEASVIDLFTKYQNSINHKFSIKGIKRKNE